MLKLKKYETYEKYNIIANNDMVVGDVNFYNNIPVKVEFSTYFKGYNFRLLYIKDMKIIKVVYSKPRASKLHSWSNEFPLKAVDPKVREMVFEFLCNGGLDDAFLPFRPIIDIALKYFAK